MPKFYSSILLFLLLINFSSYSQKKTLQAKSTVENITIDGKINEEAWASAPIATDFIMYEPDNGKPISENKKTVVKVLYDNTAIYISALLYDDEPNKISRELTNRDVFGVSDHFAVSINGYNDGQQDFRFYVSAAGVQMDCLATEDLEDFKWDAIWDSKVTLTDFGWVVEMKIPYAALRFSKAAKQTWGINFMREIKRDAQKYTWTFVDTKIGSIITQEGVLEGIENIKPPTRLFLIPYTSAYYQKDDLNSDKTLKAGLDIKYGINEAFTLDAILVPDFGQTKFDNAILNLDPFEQKLDENRAFFTEATDLFSKGNLFYSRRIGGTPIVDSYAFQDQLPVNEEVTNFPSTVDLINAVKISGRTEGGLGIGFLNAVTAKTDATIINTTTKESRKEVVQPLTNYNVLVFDQRFNQNSSVSFVNTNTVRNGSFRDANASALLFDLNSKANTYNLYGDFKYSFVTDDSNLYFPTYYLANQVLENYDGYKTQLGFAKTSGKYRYNIYGKYISKNYDINDLGILFVNNYHAGYAEMSYRITNPTKVFNTFRASQEINYDVQNTTGKNQEAWYKIKIKATTLKNELLLLDFQVNPLDRYDFYVPRSYGSYVYIPKSIYGYAAYLSDRAKPLTYGADFSIEDFDEEGRKTYVLNADAEYRFNDKLSFDYSLAYTRKVNDRGWVDKEGVTFGERNREIVEHYIAGKYSITNKMYFNLIARYYWSYSRNHEFFTLQDDGHLMPNPSYSKNKDRNYNSWNLDFSYSWWFAPGSELSILYRSYAEESANIVETNVGSNLTNLFNTNLTNILSVSIRYYIDYNSLKRKH